MNFNLKNKKVLITGSSGGIGLSLCKIFLKMECKVIFTSSNDNKLNDLKNKFGNENSYYLLNLSDTNSLPSSISKITEENTDIDILINNAGISKDNLFLRMKAEQWNEVINVNLNSNFYIIKSILPNMIKSKKGNIIGITSVVAHMGNPGQANYAASKSGMISMYKSLALEVAQRNININLISPGFIQSPMTEKLNDKQKNFIMDKIPMKKFGHPDDIANLAVFLASDTSSYITGQTFHVNGGMLML
jgi:3-oxoacyl-[acyl-carrier protein] reductase